MKIKHHSIFVNSEEVLDWERLRNDEEEQPYFLPYTKEEYLAKTDFPNPGPLAKEIIDVIFDLGLNKIFSIGSGIGAQEYQLKKFSDLTVIVSDYNNSILRLKEFGIFNDAIVLDALNDPLPVDRDFVVLFPRIDTEFDDDQLITLYRKCAEANVKYICFMPTQLLNTKGIFLEFRIFLYCLVKRKRRVFCGYFRSRKEFVKLWTPYYKIDRSFKKNKQFVFFLKLSDRF